MDGLWMAWQEGGWGMRPVLVVLVIAVVIFVERVLWFWRSAFDSESLFERLAAHAQARDVDGCVALCARLHAPVARVALAGLAKLHEDRDVVAAAVGLAVLRERPRFERRVACLGRCAWAAGFLGFLGTATTSFAVFGVSGSHGCRMVPLGCVSYTGLAIDPARAAEMTMGFASEAMRCAQFGLLAMCLASGGHALLRAAADRRRRELDAVVTRTLVLADAYRAVSEAGGPYRSHAG